MSIAIAIDGPAGAGKSTIAKLVARRLGFTYVDTGAMYRAVALAVIQLGKDPLDKEEVIAVLPSISIGLTSDDKVFLNGKDVTAAIRTPKVTEFSSPVSAIPEVRTYCVARQREMANSIDVVMDGRDIGTNVLPQAQVKVFMVASAQTRAHRRYLELIAKGVKADEKEILDDINKRDYADSNRKYNPLRKAEDAIEIDTSKMTIAQVVDEVLNVYREKTKSV